MALKKFLATLWLLLVAGSLLSLLLYIGIVAPLLVKVLGVVVGVFLFVYITVESLVIVSKA